MIGREPDTPENHVITAVLSEQTRGGCGAIEDDPLTVLPNMQEAEEL
jgi:hypothetical protein